MVATKHVAFVAKSRVLHSVLTSFGKKKATLLVTKNDKTGRQGAGVPVCFQGHRVTNPHLSRPAEKGMCGKGIAIQRN